MKEKKEVVKHSAAVQIQNNITLLQRRAWNVLLAHAYDALPTEERHRIKIKDLMRALEFTSRNEDYLKEALKALVGCKVEWNVLDKDNQWEWGVTTLLAEAIIKNGVCAYAYGPTLRERLYNPQPLDAEQV
jgi:Initiator Replication protein